MSVIFHSLTKRYGNVTAVADLDLAIAPQSFTVLCGPPRSGKSVLFRLLVGLEAPEHGSIELDGFDITSLPPARRAIGYVPQSFALYPHLSVRANIGYPLALAGAPASDVEKRVERAAAILAISHLLAKTPDQLSGGEKQRVALARGLLKNASLFVLDDPLVGLDYKLREQLMDDLKAMRAELKATFLYATSDSLEALTMAERLVVVDAGRVVQHDRAESVYHEPTCKRALELVGFPRANLLAGELREGTVTAGPWRFRCAAEPGVSPDVVIGIRPEAVRLGCDDGLPASGRVRLIEDLGGEYVVHLDIEGAPLTASYPVRDEPPPAHGEKVPLAVFPSDILVFDASTGARLGRGMH